MAYDVRVVHVTSYYGGDGAAIAAMRLHHGLRRLGVDSKIFVGERRSMDSDLTVVLFAPSRDLRDRARRRLRRLEIARTGLNRYARPAGYETFSDDRTVHGADFVAQIPQCDLVHLHAMLDFVDYRAFFRTIPQRTPVVRTLHDMNFFTGGCHYDFGCGKFADSCGACPQLGSGRDDDLSRQTWRRKTAAFAAVPPGRLHLVTASRWMAQEARRSSLVSNFPITVIPYGLDTEDFQPRDRAVGRQVFGLPPDGRIVLFAAEPVSRRLKGFALLAQALSHCRDVPGIVLATVGSGTPPVEAAIPHVRLGHIGHQAVLSLIYSAADVFVMPSLQEAFGQTAIEATACGTPVVAFGVGGLLDIVRPESTGVLVPPGDIAGLGAAIRELLVNPERRARMAAQCRTVAVEEYSLTRQPQRYLDLYRSILESQASATPAATGTTARAVLPC